MIASLMKEHDVLLKRADAVVAELGPRRAVGFDDWTACDLPKLKKAQAPLLSAAAKKRPAKPRPGGGRTAAA